MLSVSLWKESLINFVHAIFWTVADEIECNGIIYSFCIYLVHFIYFYLFIYFIKGFFPEGVTNTESIQIHTHTMHTNPNYGRTTGEWDI